MAAPAAGRPALAEKSRASGSQALRLAAILVLAALCGWSVRKGAMHGFHGTETYFWVTTYGHGLVRRGLAGTLLAPVLARAGLPTMTGLVLAINRAALAALVMLLLLGIARQSRFWAAEALAVAVFAAAPFLGQTAFLVGFPDALMALVMAALVAVAWRGDPRLLAPLSLAAALFHEFAPLAALPCVCLAAWLRPGLRPAARLAMPAALLLAILFVATAGHATQGAIAALARRLQSFGETASEAQYQANWRLAQSAGGDFAQVAREWRQWWANGLIGLAYTLPPSLLLVWLGWPRLRAACANAVPPRAYPATAALYLAACLGPLAILFIAIDLSRLAGFTALTALLTLRVLPPSRPPPGAAPAAAAVIALWLALPVYSLHLPYGFAANLRLTAPLCPACARAFVGALNVYNRGQSEAQRQEALTNPAYGNFP